MFGTGALDRAELTQIAVQMASQNLEEWWVWYLERNLNSSFSETGLLTCSEMFADVPRLARGCCSLYEVLNGF